MTTHRTLKDSLTAYRIGDPEGEFPIWDNGGARLSSGRWHEAGAPVIYASEHYSTAMLEKLVHYEGEIPSGQHFIEINVPSGTSYEVANPDLLDGWSAPDNGIRVGLRFWAYFFRISQAIDLKRLLPL